MAVDLGAVKDWTGVVGSIGGAIVGAVIALVVSSRQQSHQRRLEAETRLIAKYEELHQLFAQASSEAALCAASLLFDVQKDISIEPERIAGKVSIDHLRMLVDFYAPSLKSEAIVLQKAWTGLFALTTEVLATSERSAEWRSKVAEASPRMAKEIADQSIAAQSKLASLAANLQRVR